MGIRIDGASDLINATDGSLTIEGQSINSTGIGTFSGGVKVGSAATIHSTGQFNIGVAATIFASGNATFAGIVTAASYIGDGSALTGIAGTEISNSDFAVGVSTFFVDYETGRVGINTDVPDRALHVTVADAPSAKFGGGTHFIELGQLASGSSAGLNIVGGSNMLFRMGGTEAMRVDPSGRLLVGHNASDDRDGYDSALQVSGTGGDDSSISIGRWSGDASASGLVLSKSRNGTIGSHTVVQANDILGMIQFQGDDGTNYHVGADIRAKVESGVGNDDVPASLIFSTNAGSTGTTERARFTGLGSFGVNASSPVCTLDVGGAGRFGNANTDKHQDGCIIERNSGDGMVHITAGRSGGNYSGFNLYVAGDTGGSGANAKLRHTIDHAGNFTWYDSDGSTSRLKIDSNGRIFVGSTTNTNDLTNGGMKIQTEATDGQANALNLRNPQLTGANAAVGIVFNMDRTGGGIHFNAGGISVKKRQEWTSTPGTVDSYISLKTIIDETTAERCRIGYNQSSLYLYKVSDEVTVANAGDDTQRGVTLAGGSSLNYNIFTGYNNTIMYIGRQHSDGNLIDFRQDGAHEGSISVSGSTVSYNGGHLARWSQLPGLSNTDTSARPTIYRGTIMTNLDEMCEWTGEENLQLNKTQVSTAASDPNVGGIFWEWDDEVPIQGESHDYKNDFYVAMTGDTIIRVGAGVSVTKGDLLESAGDGTARPQSDDIIRSKTIAKVSSNVGIVTYADNSYCVPCLLMAC